MRIVRVSFQKTEHFWRKKNVIDWRKKSNKNYTFFFRIGCKQHLFKMQMCIISLLQHFTSSFLVQRKTHFQRIIPLWFFYFYHYSKHFRKNRIDRIRLNDTTRVRDTQLKWWWMKNLPYTNILYGNTFIHVEWEANELMSHETRLKMLIIKNKICLKKRPRDNVLFCIIPQNKFSYWESCVEYACIHKKKRKRSEKKTANVRFGK